MGRIGASAMQTLKAEKVVQTLEQLRRRISERFPDSGLARVCDELAEVARNTAQRARAAGRPHLLLRLVVLAVAAALIFAQIYVASLLGLDRLSFSEGGEDLTQTLESAVNLLILAGVAIWFLLTLEERLKRRQVLAHIHELRSYAHVIDMHQLTKDPAAVLGQGPPTASSPARTMSEFELLRYLDYCSEMLSLTGKLAALYGERTQDPQIIAAAADIESLTTNLGRKIWQKIVILSGGTLTRSE